MILVRTLCILCIATLIGCASSDGGPVGSGISSVSGNVIAVSDSTARGTAAAAVPAVRVTIDEVVGIEDTTDAGGNFELAGHFSGMVTLRFTVGTVTVTQRIDVPAGSTTVLADIQIRPQAVMAGAARQLGFYGEVAFVDCSAGILLVNDRKRQADQFMVRLSSETVLVRGDNQPLQCADVHAGDRITIDGLTRFSDRTVDAVTVTIAPPKGGTQQPIHQLRFFGTVAVVSCESGMLVITDDANRRTRLRLLDGSVIVGPDQRALSCQGIDAGDHVDGRGNINIRMPGAIDVMRMVVTPPLMR